MSSPRTEPDSPQPTPPRPIEIRTKIPAARIKRVMQADEEVGKLAQVTPLAVAKAVELFMVALVGGAAAKAAEKGGKKVTATHLKSVVVGSKQFDFLAEIMGRVGEVEGGLRKRGGEKTQKKKRGREGEAGEEEKKPKKARKARKEV